jgi:hypothetical protein
LGYWGLEVLDLCRRLGANNLRARLVIGRNCQAPTGDPSATGAPLTIERDPMELRGTGGVLRDIAQDYDDQDLILVANANQLYAESLAVLAGRLFDHGIGDARLLANAKDAPTGLMILSCSCLRGISSSGYVDLKEQALPAIGRRCPVGVVRGGPAAVYSIRRWNDFISALWQRHQPPGAAATSAFQEDWQPRFSIAESAASVAASAGVHDSVVLAGGRVEAKATVVRSLVAPGGVVRKGEIVVGRLVTAEGELE